MTDEQYYRLYLDGDETGLSELMKNMAVHLLCILTDIFMIFMKQKI